MACSRYMLYSLEAHESSGLGLAAVVEDEAEVDGQVEVDAEDLALDGGAEADGGFKVDEALKQRAAGLSGRHGNLGLDQPSTLAHTPSFSASRGHLPYEAGVGVGVDGVDGVGVGQFPPQALAMANTTMLTARNRAIEALPAIAAQKLVDHTHKAAVIELY
ncbi:hypothetical protein PR202_gb14748 [Eleusine coracana subsp. coracana]|uniref:Uncharacterized protein n=1 Tax=Eleusine coracana subsp. coracana TaxID=191504 RepID=A0AAV5ETR3_ELECO|nr:hypothetical protein PR202_gb14748 [Eleusine coracana subsp. coracana]